MLVFRIASTEHVRDLTGTGARRYGGRWNRKGTPVVYTSETRSLATVEYLVHVPQAWNPAGLSIASIQIPDDILPQEIELKVLPSNRRSHPPPPRLAALAAAWIQDGRRLLLRVPSAVVEHEYNLLINPQHPEISRVLIADVEPYSFDGRLLRRGAR